MSLLIIGVILLLIVSVGKNYSDKLKLHRAYLQKMDELAAERGGKCLSEKYVSASSKLTWECAEGHVWEAAPHVVKRGRWCPQCAGLKSLTIEAMQEIAAKNGGRCLSEKYVNSTTKLKWECREGHTWEATSNEIKQGQWCPECSTAKQLTIEGMQEFAIERGGRCLSEKYVDFSSDLTWTCNLGHVWDATPHAIKRGEWCPKCKESKGLTIEGMQEVALERGGKCLSDTYINSSTKLRWECQAGHIWEATPNEIGQGKWCPDCEGVRRFTIEGMNEIAMERGGKCLSTEYVNSATKLKWECREGHVWESTPNAIEQGDWCPQCAGAKRLTIDGMQEIAAERGGRCLSTEYVNSSTKLKWECALGHVWEATPQAIKKGKWCVECAGSQFTIEAMQKLASERGGICLSNRYVNTSTKLEWECDKGHTWEAAPNVVRKGEWCPECSLDS